MSKLQDRLSKFEKLLDEFDNTHRQSEIECICDDSVLEEQYSERSNFIN